MSYTAIASQTLASSASSVTFSSIPGTFRDLVIVMQAKTTGASDRSILMRINSDTGSNYNRVDMAGDGSSATSTSGTGTSFTVAPCPVSAVGHGIVELLDYSATDKHKSQLTRNANASSAIRVYAHRWANTSAVTTILLYPNQDDIAAGSTFSLYGIE